MIRFCLHKVAVNQDILKMGAMAKKAGLDITTVSRLWNNKAARIDAATLNALCTALNCTPGDLIEYIPDVPAEPAAQTKRKR